MSDDIRKWIDYDLTIVPPDQSAGLIEQPPEELLASFGDIPWFDEVCAGEMIPESQWKDRAAKMWPMQRQSVTQIYSQGSEGSCVGFSCCQALETTLRRTYGLQRWVSLSGMSLYKRIGRSAGSGAYIPDGIAEMQSRGVLPVNSDENKARYKHTHPRTGFSNPLPSGWEETGALFRVTKAAKAQGRAMVGSALLSDRIGIVGRSRHAIPYIGLTYSGNSPVAGYANSWGNWGDGGFGYDSASTFGSVVLYIILEVSTRPDLEIPSLA